MRPSFSTPWPMTRQLQWAQVGARAWMAHSKLSNVCEAPRIVTWKALSYSFPHTSQRAAGIVDLRASGREAPLVRTGLAVGDLPHRFRRARPFLDLGDVGQADHADHPAVLVGDDHARLLALSHELLRDRDVIV